ncbi:MAG TPA: DUF262 domain-containing protein [Bryobacteraceae bacterium]|nr:DUF262 domain-containing protein [Bryobacteraceae bacterium]
MPTELETDPTDIDLEDQRTEEGDDEEVQPFRYAISSYGADYPVDGLVKRIREDAIYIPKFQREFVWDIKDASRFVESLLLGLPVPSIFLSKEWDTGKLLVVDGQQRLLSLRYFYDDLWKPSGKEFRLKGVQPEFEGKTYSALRDEDRRQLDDAILHAIVFKQDEPSEDESSVYEVFRRLNTGGKKLTPQEVRSAVHHSGRIRNLLGELNQYASWRDIYGPQDSRMRDQELILRFLALLHEGKDYRSPMVTFLNMYMGKNKELSDKDASAISEEFRNAIDLVHRSLGNRAFRPVRALNAAVFDSVMVGTAKRLERGPVSGIQAFRNAYDALLKSQDFLDACGRGTASGERVRKRMDLAEAAFDSVL